MKELRTLLSKELESDQYKIYVEDNLNNSVMLSDHDCYNAICMDLHEYERLIDFVCKHKPFDNIKFHKAMAKYQELWGADQNRWNP
jgi:hypothetical protein